MSSIYSFFFHLSLLNYCNVNDIAFSVSHLELFSIIIMLESVSGKNCVRSKMDHNYQYSHTDFTWQGLMFTMLREPVSSLRNASLHMVFI